MANCQILQTSVNRYKSNKVNLAVSDMQQNSKIHKITHRDMDLVEYALYGDINRYDLETNVVNNMLHNFDR